jgi:hypothetical protein
MAAILAVLLAETVSSSHMSLQTADDCLRLSLPEDFNRFYGSGTSFAGGCALLLGVGCGDLIGET